jgi:hypothetical protein
MAFRLTALAVVALNVLPMHGCVVWEIRDEMIKANATLATADQSLRQTIELLEGVRADLRALETTNRQLVLVGERLTSADERLQLLTPIDASLKALDAHLASLRTTLENIDSTIPFLSFADEEGAASQPETQPDGSTTQPATTRPRVRPRPRPPQPETQPATQPPGS